MGYFPNGSSGSDYQAKWCERCIHDNPEKDIYCPIWTLHLIHNYEECNKPNSFLHTLIPLSKDKLGNERCTMFVERGLLSNLAIEKFEHEAAQLGN